MCVITTLFNDVANKSLKIHSFNVQNLTYQFSKYINDNPEFLNFMFKAQLFHDIGKTAYPQSDLCEEKIYSKDDMKYMELHPIIGYNLAKRNKKIKDVSFQIKHHHENWDGSGYPDKLKKKNIPLDARIIQICDSTETMMMGRKYQIHKSDDEIINDLYRNSKIKYDPILIDIFINNFENITKIISSHN